MNATASRGSTVIPCLRYRNAPIVIDWLCNAFGFKRHAVSDQDSGGRRHACRDLEGRLWWFGNCDRWAS